eukprot:g11426.t1
MADDWDDWGDDDDKSAKGSDKSEEWDWPASERGSSAAAAAAAALGAKQEQQELDQSPIAEENEARDAAVDELMEKYFLELQKYLEDLADPSVREEINQELTKRGVSSLARYYDGRDDLAAYTLDTELRRMKYSIVAEDGRRVGGAVDASGSGSGQGGDGGGAPGGTAVREFLSGRRGSDMLRMANQSIFADMLEAIQGRLLRPDLEISVISRDCEFSLDFSKGVLEAHSLFEVSTVGNGRPGAPETLEIAQIKGTVCLDTENQVCSQRLLSPQLRMVFDDAMRASARVLALHSLMDGGMSDFGAGPEAGKAGKSGSLDRMGSLRTSLARASSDGMGRAAAAGTGLLANVVAGVGSAIGATRSGTEGEYVAGGGGGSGGIGIGGSGGGGAAPLVQLYRRTDADETAGRAGASAAPAATTRTNFRTSVGSITNTGNSSSVLPERERADVARGESNSSKVRGLNEFMADAADAAGEDGGLEPRSALGVASATGGAVLRGLWGGVQAAAAAGMGVARQGGSGGDGASGGGDVQPPSEFRLYRREGDP